MATEVNEINGTTQTGTKIKVSAVDGAITDRNDPVDGTNDSDVVIGGGGNDEDEAVDNKTDELTVAHNQECEKPEFTEFYPMFKICTKGGKMFEVDLDAAPGIEPKEPEFNISDEQKVKLEQYNLSKEVYELEKAKYMKYWSCVGSNFICQLSGILDKFISKHEIESSHFRYPTVEELSEGNEYYKCPITKGEVTCGSMYLWILFGEDVAKHPIYTYDIMGGKSHYKRFSYKKIEGMPVLEKALPLKAITELMNLRFFAYEELKNCLITDQQVRSKIEGVKVEGEKLGTDDEEIKEVVLNDMVTFLSRVFGMDSEDIQSNSNQNPNRVGVYWLENERYVKYSFIYAALLMKLPSYDKISPSAYTESFANFMLENIVDDGHETALEDKEVENGKPGIFGLLMRQGSGYQSRNTFMIWVLSDPQLVNGIQYLNV